METQVFVCLLGGWGAGMRVRVSFPVRLDVGYWP